MTACEFLRWMRDEKRVPYSAEGQPHYPPSNSELRRWVTNGSVLVDGQTLTLDTQVEFPVREIVFFPAGRRRTTMPGFGERA